MVSYSFIKNLCKIHYIEQNSLELHKFIFLVHLVLNWNSKIIEPQQTLLVKEILDILNCFTIYVYIRYKMPLAMQNGFFQKGCASVAKVKLQEKYHICMMLKSASKKVSLKRTHHSILLQTLLNFSTIGAIYA